MWVWILLGGGVLLLAFRKSGAGEALDSDTKRAVDLALQKETDPNVLMELSKRLAGAGFTSTARVVRDRAIAMGGT